MEFGASPRASADIMLSAKDPPSTVRRPTASLALLKHGIAIRSTRLAKNVSHFRQERKRVGGGGGVFASGQRMAYNWALG